MGKLGWTIDREEGLVTVRGAGVYDLAFATSLRLAMWAEGTVGYRKLLDLSRADIRLTSEDLETMVASTRSAGATIAGPIAIVLGQDPDPLLLDMAVLLKSRIGNRRRLRVFTEEAAARHWLSSEAGIAELSGALSRRPHLGVANFARVR
ncbi:hypothetical protein [uncultured Reyranella sp.]|uniref:hypothetical protein n=1 Tax=uncultured Reyranella sp. TaxID=735512 RepID=UPI0025F2D9CE|nr:hypothetical protein [uncultured Reyranella sp.]